MVRAKGFATFFDFCDIFDTDIGLIAQIVVTLQKYERKSSMKKLYKGMQDPTKSFLLIGTDEEVADIREELNGQGMNPQIRSVLPDALYLGTQSLSIQFCPNIIHFLIGPYQQKSFGRVLHPLI